MKTGNYEILCNISRPSRGRQHLSACAGYGNYIIHTLEHFHLNILRSVQLHNLTHIFYLFPVKAGRFANLKSPV